MDKILDKGIVIDAWVRVSVLGLELLTIEARVVVASVETYLKYAEAIRRIELASKPAGEEAPAPIRGVTQSPFARDEPMQLKDLPEKLGELPEKLGLAPSGKKKVEKMLAEAPKMLEEVLGGSKEQLAEAPRKLVEAAKKALGAEPDEGASKRPHARKKSEAPEEEEQQSSPSEDDVVEVLAEHSEGIGFDELEEQLDVSKEKLEGLLQHLLDRHRARWDERRDIFFAAHERR